MTDLEVTEAVILRVAPFGESDRMASLLMADGSRREVRVGQARKSRKRFGGFDLYVRAECRFGPDRKGRSRLDSIDVREGHDGLRGDLVRSALAAHVAELTVQASQEGHPLPDLYRLTVSALESLAGGSADRRPLGWARGFELKLLHVVGVRPALLRDAASGRAIQADDAVRWSTTHGGPIGPDGPIDARSLPIRVATLQHMNDALRTPLSQQEKVLWTEETGGQAEHALQDFLATHVGNRQRARRFLAEVLGGLPVVLAFALMAGGCGGYAPPASVRVQGYLFESPEPSTDEPTVPGATAFARDDLGELVSEGSEPFSDAPGWVRFSGLAPLKRHHHVFVPPPGEDHPEVTEHVTTVVVGVSSSDDLFVDAGSFHLWPRSTVEGWLTAWELVSGGRPLTALDPEVDEGGFVRGTVLEPDAALGTRFALVDADGVQHRAVYLDDAGAPSATQEGLSGSGGFFVFGSASGLAMLRTVQDDDTLAADGLPVWIEEDGVTSLPRLQVGE